MKTSKLPWLGSVSTILLLSLTAPSSYGLPINLGSAGPSNWAVLETGAGAANANVSIANASNAGTINGNVGIATTGNISDSGTPVNGSVYANTAGSINANVAANVSGSVYHNAAANLLLNQAVSDAANAVTAALALPSTSIANITTGGTFAHAPGVYSLSQINLSGATLTLQGSASDYYIFNISSALTLSHASILLSGGLTPDNVLFNITRSGGTGLGMSGGLSTESVLYGIVLANDSSVSEAPGLVVGEIISGQNIGIASGAQVEGLSVPDGGSSITLLSMGCGLIILARKKLLSK